MSYSLWHPHGFLLKFPMLATLPAKARLRSHTCGQLLGILPLVMPCHTNDQVICWMWVTWMNERSKNSTSLLNLTPISSSRFRLYLDSLDASTSTPQEKQQVTKFFHDFMICSVLFHGIGSNPHGPIPGLPRRRGVPPRRSALHGAPGTARRQRRRAAGAAGGHEGRTGQEP